MTSFYLSFLSITSHSTRICMKKGKDNKIVVNIVGVEVCVRDFKIIIIPANWNECMMVIIIIDLANRSGHMNYRIKWRHHKKVDTRDVIMSLTNFSVTRLMVIVHISEMKSWMKGVKQMYMMLIKNAHSVNSDFETTRHLFNKGKKLDDNNFDSSTTRYACARWTRG